MHPLVKNVSTNNNYKLTIEFDNVESGILEMKPFLELGVFKNSKEKSAFKWV